jgi:hypothetical protein
MEQPPDVDRVLSILMSTDLPPTMRAPAPMPLQRVQQVSIPTLLIPRAEFEPLPASAPSGRRQGSRNRGHQTTVHPWDPRREPCNVLSSHSLMSCKVPLKPDWVLRNFEAGAAAAAAARSAGARWRGWRWGVRGQTQADGRRRRCAGAPCARQRRVPAAAAAACARLVVS